MCDQTYPFPQVFLVDGAGSPQHSTQLPNLVPCWSFPPAQDRVRSHGKSRGYMGVSPGLAMVVLCLFLLVFSALGFELYQIHNIQKKLARTPEVKNELEVEMPEKQIGLYQYGSNGKDTDQRTAAHVLGMIKQDGSHKTLRWEPMISRAFIVGKVSYRIEDGALQVNESGIYHIYSRVELIFKHCLPDSSFDHTVFVRRAGHSPQLKLMETHKAGFCSQQNGHSWTTDSYLGATLQLLKGDRVLVNVSHPLLLSHSYYGNFFGLYQI